MRFRIHQPSYIDGVFIDQGMIDATNGKGHEVEVKPLALKGQKIAQKAIGKRPGMVTLTEDLHHVPGPHWEPVDDEARALCAKHKHDFTGELPDVMPVLEDQLAEAQKAVLHPDSAGTIADAVVGALAKAGMLKEPATAKR